MLIATRSSQDFACCARVTPDHTAIIHEFYTRGRHFVACFVTSESSFAAE